MNSNNWSFDSRKKTGVALSPKEGEDQDPQTKVYNPWGLTGQGFSIWKPKKSTEKSDDEYDKVTKVKPVAKTYDDVNDENEENIVVQYVKLSSDAIVPKRMSSGAAGYDLYSTGDHCIAPMSKEEISIGLQIHLPVNTYGRIAPRSGLASQHFIHVGAGVIDRDYRGCVTVLLFNFGAAPFFVFKGDRIAQLIIERTAQPVFVEAEGSLDNTSRGFAGRGSTGRR